MFWLRGKNRGEEHQESAVTHAHAATKTLETASELAQQQTEYEDAGHDWEINAHPAPEVEAADAAAIDSAAAMTAEDMEVEAEIEIEAEETYEVIVTYESSSTTLPLPGFADSVARSAPEAEVVPPANEQQVASPSKDHDQLYARNWAFIDAELQERLANATLFAAGTGLGSLVSTLAVRTGFSRFILADGDQVENTNLNRQAFEQAQLGHNKAISTAEQIRRIQPDAQIDIIPRFVDETDFPSLIARSDIIVNTIDFNSQAFLSLNRLASAAGKSVLFPFNLGWGGALLVFTPDSATLDEFAGIDPEAPFSQDVVTSLIMRVIERIPGGPPLYFQELLGKYATRTPESWPYDPQLGVGTHITASLVVQAAVSLLAGWPIRTAPDIAWCDARAAMSVTHQLALASP